MGECLSNGWNGSIRIFQNTLYCYKTLPTLNIDTLSKNLRQIIILPSGGIRGMRPKCNHLTILKLASIVNHIVETRVKEDLHNIAPEVNRMKTSRSAIVKQQVHALTILSAWLLDLFK